MAVFRAEGIGHALTLIRYSLANGVLLQQFTDGTIFMMGLSRLGVYQLIFALIVLLIVDIFHERGVSLRDCVSKCNIVIRWGIYLVVLVAFVVLIVQNYGRPAAEFIYFQF